MTHYNTLNVKLSNSQLEFKKFVILLQMVHQEI